MSSAFAGRLAVVTGGAGFIGSHLVDALLSRGASVRVLDDFSTGRMENLAHVRGRIEILEGDIRDLAVCRRAVGGATVVFHEAALGSVPRSMKDPQTTIAVNTFGTTNVFFAAHEAGVARVVYASSSSVYGDSPSLPKREGEEGEPLSPYAASKKADEDLARVFSRCYGMELVGLRYFNVYGPRQDPDGPYAAVIPRFFAAQLRGLPPVIYGRGDQSRDFTWVGDAVAANLLAAEAPSAACGRVYNVAGGARITVTELAGAIRETVGGGPAPRHEAPRAGDIAHSLADLTLVRASIGYEPRTDLPAGLALSREYYAALFSSSPLESEQEERRAAGGAGA